MDFSPRRKLLASNDSACSCSFMWILGLNVFADVARMAVKEMMTSGVHMRENVEWDQVVR